MALNDANCMMVLQQLLNAVKSFIRLEKSCVKSTGGKGCQTPDVLDGQCLDFTGIELDGFLTVGPDVAAELKGGDSSRQREGLRVVSYPDR